MKTAEVLEEIRHAVAKARQETIAEACIQMLPRLAWAVGRFFITFRVQTGDRLFGCRVDVLPAWRGSRWRFVWRSELCPATAD